MGELEQLQRMLARTWERMQCRPKSERGHCGAHCRSRGGAPCLAPPVWDKLKDQPRNGRCRMHGGLSTGARTEEGRARQAAGTREYWIRIRRARAVHQ
jgi:hypothetical protein